MSSAREISAQCPSTSSSSSWMDVSVDFSDGHGVTSLRVDLPTFHKVMEKDPATLALLKQHREIQLIADSEESKKSKPSSDSVTPSTAKTKGAPARGNESNAEEEKETPDRKIPKVWGRQETKLLIDLRVEKDSAFKSGKRAHKTLWVDIAKLLGEHGYDFSADNCSNKWKSLKRAYKDVIDHNSKTGNDPQTCAFFETFNLIYGNSPSTRPQFTLDSTTSTEAEMKDTAEEGVEGEGMPPNNPDKRLAGRKCRKKKGTSATVEWLNSWKDEEETRKKEREDATERRHEEKMRRFDRLLDILENMPNK